MTSAETGVEKLKYLFSKLSDFGPMIWYTTRSLEEGKAIFYMALITLDLCSLYSTQFLVVLLKLLPA